MELVQTRNGVFGPGGYGGGVFDGSGMGFGAAESSPEEIITGGDPSTWSPTPIAESGMKVGAGVVALAVVGALGWFALRR